MPGVAFVVFDMDEVLYDYRHQTRLDLLEQLTGRPAAEIDAAVWGGPHEEAAEAGQPGTAEAYLAQYGQLLGYPIDFDTWCDVRRRMMRPRPDVLSLVKRITAKADTALLTNNGMMLKAALPVCAPEAFEIFGSKAHVSAEFRLRKPDPRIYRAICEKYGYEPGRCVFVDDKLENVSGAEEAGLIGHHYSSCGALEAFLLDHKLI
ncbi:Alpha-D-glucose-1-phosphate phosphatase YihX [Labrenzia sp. THAF82]|uniref:HAD-IA family hydrolase n=1 Tax=Labrenzia sp. THAF82 TaxID=2587861 RepID=UPI00126969DA|nr:HAD-IA family hydrolase [Labrenzia sp. THAF82]QFT33699.1 Alpha-D-glucose-1-phosphate phosphatase YihX [Labrenzia sp. THAF82]